MAAQLPSNSSMVDDGFACVWPDVMGKIIESFDEGGNSMSRKEKNYPDITILQKRVTFESGES